MKVLADRDAALRALRTLQRGSLVVEIESAAPRPRCVVCGRPFEAGERARLTWAAKRPDELRHEPGCPDA